MVLGNIGFGANPVRVGLIQALGGMSTIDRGSQKWILAGSSFMLIYGLYCADKSVRAGHAVFEYRNLKYTDEVAIFIIASIIVVATGLLITSVRNLRK